MDNQNADQKTRNVTQSRGSTDQINLQHPVEYQTPNQQVEYRHPFLLMAIVLMIMCGVFLLATVTSLEYIVLFDGKRGIGRGLFDSGLVQFVFLVLAATHLLLLICPYYFMLRSRSLLSGALITTGITLFSIFAVAYYSAPVFTVTPFLSSVFGMAVAHVTLKPLTTTTDDKLI